MTRPGAFLTVALIALLHAFSHAYGVMLVPLYLHITRDLHLPGVKSAALVVAVYGAVYFLLSYPAGILADRHNRRNLLALGLLGNAAAIVLMGLTARYSMLLMLAAAAGMFGTLFHPAANALAPAHMPRSPGMALGLIGIGSGIGFFAGSQYSGWCAEHAVHNWGGLLRWQIPCVDLGLAGLVFGALFLAVAREAPHVEQTGTRPAVALGPGMRRRTLAVAIVSACRDFAGVGAMSLLSIYLQKARGFDAAYTGWLLGAMGLVSIAATPLGLWLTAGRRRLPGLALTKILGGLTLALIPLAPATLLLPALTVFQAFHLGSYAISEVALVERVDPDARGRVVGLYLTVAGTLGACSPWVVGAWTDLLGKSAAHNSAYIPLFAALAALMAVAAAAVRPISRLGARRQAAPARLPPAGAGEI